MVGRMIACLGAGLLAASPAAAQEANSADAYQRLEAAWLAGDLEAVNVLAHDLVEEIEHSACPWREDVVTAAFMGFVSAHVEGPAHSRYLAWVIDTVLDRVPVSFPEDLREAAEAMKAEPGRSIDLDHRFVNNPYLRAPREIGCAPRRLDPGLISYTPDEASALVLIVHDRGSLQHDWSRAELIYAYPAEEGPQMIEQLRQLSQPRTQEPYYHLLDFDPCETFSSTELGTQELCRQERGNSQASPSP